MAHDVERAGQALLNAELHNGLAAKDAELHAHRMGQILAPASGASSDALKKISALQQEVKRLASQVQIEQSYANKATRDVEQLNNAILEWMHFNEAFKRLARFYGGQLGQTDEQRQARLDELIIAVAGEDPELAATKAGENARKRQAARMPGGDQPSPPSQ